MLAAHTHSRCCARGRNESTCLCAEQRNCTTCPGRRNTQAMSQDRKTNENAQRDVVVKSAVQGKEPPNQPAANEQQRASTARTAGNEAPFIVSALLGPMGNSTTRHGRPVCSRKRRASLLLLYHNNVNALCYIHEIFLVKEPNESRSAASSPVRHCCTNVKAEKR